MIDYKKLWDLMLEDLNTQIAEYQRLQTQMTQSRNYEKTLIFKAQAQALQGVLETMRRLPNHERASAKVTKNEL